MFEVSTYFGFASFRKNRRLCRTMEEAQAYIRDRKDMYGDRMNQWGILFDVREVA